MQGNILYYMGPSPAREGRPIGSAGPTTASRMDKYTPALLDMGMAGMIGKGRRSVAVKEAVVRNGAVYFAAVGGAGALLSKSIKKSEVIAYDDLGTEAIRRLEDPALAGIPIIALSANAFESDRRLSTESGMNAHLTKPLDIPILLETIARIVPDDR